MRSRISPPLWSIAPTWPDVDRRGGGSAENRHRAAVRLEQAEQDVDRRRLARSVRPEERDGFATPDRDVDSAHRMNVPVRLDEAAEFDPGRSGHRLTLPAGRTAVRPIRLLRCHRSRSREDVPRRPERRTARGGLDDRGAAARDRRRRLGQDPRSHLPRRAPAGCVRRRAERDPCDHVHEQGRRRDARADRGRGRPEGAGDLDPDLPRRLRPDPAPRGASGSATARTSRSTTRPTSSASSGTCLQELERDPKRFVPRGIHTQISNAKNALIGPDEYASRVASFYDQTVADVYAPLPASAVRLERGRLRRHADADRRRAAALPGSARALGEDVPLRAGRRVPGHEPRAVRPAASCSPASTGT